MSPIPATLSVAGAAVLEDGARVPLSPDELHRVLYALTSLAVTPLRQHLRVVAIHNNAGDELWPCEARA